MIWEYCEIDLDDPEMLAAAGKEGWEVAAYFKHNRVLMKRRIVPDGQATKTKKHASKADGPQGE